MSILGFQGFRFDRSFHIIIIYMVKTYSVQEIINHTGIYIDTKTKHAGSESGRKTGQKIEIITRCATKCKDI